MRSQVRESLTVHDLLDKESLSWTVPGLFSSFSSFVKMLLGEVAEVH